MGRYQNSRVLTMELAEGCYQGSGITLSNRPANHRALLTFRSFRNQFMTEAYVFYWDRSVPTD